MFEKVRAYKVLAHAEMEYYFEEVALEIAQKAYRKWSSSNKASTPLLSLVAYYDGQFPSPPDMHGGNNCYKRYKLESQHLVYQLLTGKSVPATMASRKKTF